MAQVVGGIRGSVRSRSKLRAGKRVRTVRRHRDDVSVRFVSADGRVVTEDNITDVLRSLISEDAEPKTFKKMAEIAGKAPQTLSKLWYGDTQKPSMSTQIGVLKMYGYKMRITRDN